MNDVNYLTIAVFSFIGIIILSSVVMVNTGYVGVLNTFGEATTILKPGLHFIIPFIQGTNSLNMQVVKYEVPSSAASKDLQYVTTTITVNYKIKKDQAMMIWTEFRGTHESNIIEPLTHETLKSITAQYTANDLITKREQVKTQVANKLKENLNEYGLDVVEVSLVNFDFSAEFNKAIEQKMVAEQDKLRMQQDLEKTQIEVQKRVAVAEADATSLKLSTDAQVYMINKLAEAKAESIRKINSQITPEYINYYQIENWDGKLPQVVSDNTGLLYNIGK